MGVVASNIFLNRDAPKYIPALGTTATFGAAGLTLTLLLGGWMVLDNKRRDARQGVRLRVQDVPTGRLREGPGVEEFRWFY